MKINKYNSNKLLTIYTLLKLWLFRRRKSKKDDDPEWLPDPEVEEELNAMNGAPTYRISRQKSKF